MGAVDCVYAVLAPAVKLALEHVCAAKLVTEQIAAVVMKPAPEQYVACPKPNLKPSHDKSVLYYNTSITAYIASNLSVHPDASVTMRYFTKRTVVERFTATTKKRQAPPCDPQTGL